MKQGCRILYIVNAFERDAPTSITLAIARGVKANGAHVLVAAWARGGEVMSELEDDGIAVAQLGSNPWARYRELRRLVTEFGPDIVHSSLTRPTLGYYMAQRFLPHHAVWVAADHGVHEWRERGEVVGCLMSVMMPWALNRSDIVLTVSDEARIDLIRAGVDDRFIRVVPNGIDVERFSATPETDRTELTGRYFPDVTGQILLCGSAGNLRRVKGYDVLLRGFARLVKSVPEARLIIWGAGDDSDYLFRLRSELELNNQVAFAGRTERLQKYLPCLDMYVQPSRAESFGMAAAEAMACGVPVVAACVGGLKSLVKDNVTGLQFAPEDADDLSRKMKLLAGDGPLRSRLASAGAQLVRQQFTQQQMVDGISNVYDDALGRIR